MVAVLTVSYSLSLVIMVYNKHKDRAWSLLHLCQGGGFAPDLPAHNDRFKLFGHAPKNVAHYIRACVQRG